MSQSDMNLANLPFASARADLNNIFSALASNSSGSSDPSTTFPGQLFNDTANNVLKVRNDANNAWIELAFLDQSTNEWQVRTGVIQAVDSDGVQIKTDEGTTRLTISDSGDATFTGTIQTPNISDGTDTVATGYVVNGSAKAWACVNQTGTQTVLDSFNIASITDTSVGETVYSLTNIMNNAFYSLNGTGTNGNNYVGVHDDTETNGFNTASQYNAETRNFDGTNEDAKRQYTTIHGDLA